MAMAKYTMCETGTMIDESRSVGLSDDVFCESNDIRWLSSVQYQDRCRTRSRRQVLGTMKSGGECRRTGSTTTSQLGFGQVHTQVMQNDLSTVRTVMLSIQLILIGCCMDYIFPLKSTVIHMYIHVNIHPDHHQKDCAIFLSIMPHD